MIKVVQNDFEFEINRSRNVEQHLYIPFVIFILGEIIGELKDAIPRPQSAHVYDLCVEKDMLIVPRYQEKQALLYKIKY